MCAARALSPNEITAMLTAARSAKAAGMVLLGVSTGYRISELLSLRVRDVWFAGRPADEVTIARRQMKFGRGCRRRSVRARTVPLNADAKRAVLTLVGADPEPARFLFRSQKGRNRAIRPKQAIRLIRQMAADAGIDARRVTTHSLRKTFARRLYDLTNHDLEAVRHGLGHRSVETSRLYLELEETVVTTAILAMSLVPESDDRTAANDTFGPHAPIPFSAAAALTVPA
jgi:integrase